jgi:hypothetical protein
MRLLFSHFMLGSAREVRQRGVLRVLARHVRRGYPRTGGNLKTVRNYHRMEAFPGSSTVEHSAVNREL